MEQRFTFNGVADLYDAARPGYPERLFVDLLAAARLAPGDEILEIGCGTGRATRGLAANGFSVVALDPGRDMLRVAREQLRGFDNVQFIEATFEAWPHEPARFRLVAAAQSLHWIDSRVGLTKIASVLMPGGSLAVFGNVPIRLSPEPLWREFQRIYAGHAPTLLGPPAEAWYLPNGALAQMLDESSLFAAIAHRCYPWVRPYGPQAYVDRLSTLSNHQLLAPSVRTSLTADVFAAIAAAGGKLELHYESHLYMACLAA